MRSSLYIILILIFLIQCKPSKSVLVSENASSVAYTIPISTQLIEIDKLGQIYLLTTKNELLRLNQSYQITHRYFDNSLGEITLIDASNPLRILVYQAGFGRLTILDNTLSVMKDINLVDLGFTDIEAIAKSNDDNIWCYDPNTYRLIKLNELGQTILESNLLLGLGLKDLNISRIVEMDNYVYLLDSSLGILIFDNLGQYIKTFRRQGITNFSVRKSFISFLEEGSLLTYDTRFFEETKTIFPEEIPKEGLLNLLRGNQKWYAVYKDGIIVR